MQIQEIREKLAAAVGGEERFAGSFSARTFRDLNERAKRELDEAARSAAAVIELVVHELKREGLEEHSQFDAADFVSRYVSKWAAYQAAGARTMNWMITGPARFPVDRNRKRMDTEHKRLEELIAFEKGAPAAAVIAAKKARARALGPAGMANAELEDLRKRLADRVERQELMKLANAAIRRHGKKPREEAIAAIELELKDLPKGKVMVSALSKAGLLSLGFESYQLSNNNAEIRRLEQRIREVAAKAERLEQAPEAPAEKVINGVVIREDAADDRIRLIFDGKPAPEVIAALKGRGFRWSPTNGAWQRQLTNNARYAAECVAKAVAA